MFGRISGGLFAAALLLASAPAALAHDATTSSATRSAAPGRVSSVSAPRSATASSGGAWTRYRMRHATPYTLPASAASTTTTQVGGATTDGATGTAPTDPSHGVLSRPTVSTAASSRRVVPRTAGKLFFSLNGGDYVCSASSVNSKTKNLVVTAGHCVYDPSTASWGYDFAFVPRYHDGHAPEGVWRWRKAWAFNAWMANEDFQYDQSLIKMRPRHHHRLVKVVGGNGLAWGYPVKQRSVTIWGWPAESPYDGSKAVRCHGRTHHWYAGSPEAITHCPMTGGASGGPWLVHPLNANLGYVFAVTSRRTVSSPHLLSDPNPSVMADMLAATR
jgi:hypothetical protein